MLKEISEYYDGFKLLGINKNFLDYFEDVYVFEHEITGAKICYIPSDIPNLTFNLSFCTPCKDSTGVRHIIEHSVLCGSEKYRSLDPFRDVANRSMSFFMNAFTGMSYTYYPFSTNNETDFLNLADFYLDSCFNPLMLRDRTIFEAEGWHYEFSESGELKINGVVYNEMKKSMTDKGQVLRTQVLNDIFPKSSISYVSGGDPKYIPKLTYEKFVSYHDKYYHPSNSFLCIYGNMDISKVFEIVNSYYSKYQKRVIKDDYIYRERSDDKHEFVSSFPATEYEASSDSNIVRVTYKFPKVVCPQDEWFIEFFACYTRYGADTRLKRAIIKTHLADKVSTVVTFNKIGSYFMVTAEGVKREDVFKTKELIKKAVSSYVKLAEKDFENMKKCLDIFIYDEHDKNCENFPLQLTSMLTRINSEHENVLTCESRSYLKVLSDDIAKNGCVLFTEIIKKYFEDNVPYEHIFYPDTKYGLKIDKKEKARLRNKLSNLNEEDCLSIIEENELIIKNRERTSTPEEIATIPKLTLSDLPKSINWIDNETIIRGGIPIKYYEAGFPGVICARFKFDLNGLSIEELRYARLIAELLFYADNKSRSVAKVRDATNNLLVSKVTTVDASDVAGDRFIVEVEIRYEKLKEAFDYLIETFKDKNYGDTKYLHEVLINSKNAVAGNIVNNPQNAVSSLLVEGFSRAGFVKAMWQGMNFIDFIDELLKIFDKGSKSELDKLSSKLRRISKKIFSKNRLEIAIIASNTALVKDILAPKFVTMGRVLDRKRQDVYPGYDILDVNKAIVINSLVNYVGIRFDMRDLKIGRYAKLAIASILRNEYLWQEVRLVGGAYGALCSFSYEGYLTAISYRDPHYKETINRLRRMCLYLENYDGNIEDVIIKTYASLERVDGIYSVVDKVCDLEFVGINKYDYAKEINELLSLTIEDIHEAGRVMHKALKDARYAAAAREDILKEDEKRYYHFYRL